MDGRALDPKPPRPGTGAAPLGLERARPVSFGGAGETEVLPGIAARVIAGRGTFSRTRKNRPAGSGSRWRSGRPPLPDSRASGTAVGMAVAIG